jgi:FixJ family two-component response regulator
MSSHLDDALVTDGAGTGAVFLAKPFSGDALLGAIATAVGSGVAQGSKR